jgi:tetratricopeptide (TPR) repeat protein
MLASSGVPKYPVPGANCQRKRADSAVPCFARLSRLYSLISENLATWFLEVTMRKSFQAFLLATCLSWALSLAAQTPCPGLSVVVNTPEDELMLAVNGAEKPEDQIAALDKFAQAHPDSKFMPCVNEFYTSTYVKLNKFDKATEYGEKDVAANYSSLNLSVNLLKAYLGSGKAPDAAFILIAKAPDLIKSETNPSRPAKATDAEWQKMQGEGVDLAKQHRAFMEYAFFQLLPRIPDPRKRLEYLEAFSKSYPDSPNTAQLNYGYFMAYEMAGDATKADEYGEKAVAADPNNTEALDLLALDYSVFRRTSPEKAAIYAKKVLTLVPAMKKPDSASDEEFKALQNNRLGMAHLALGYTNLLKAGKTHRAAAAIQDFKTASEMLSANPQMQAQALYFLGYAYEQNYPANHHAAAEALSRASALDSPIQAQARDLLTKVKAAR